MNVKRPMLADGDWVGSDTVFGAVRMKRRDRTSH